MTWQYRVMALIVRFVFMFRARLVASGLEHVPSGGFIVAANHQSNWDPPALGLAIWKRQLRALGKQELFDMLPGFDKFLTWLGAIPIRRGEADREALAQCRDLLRAGDALIMMPEGTRSRNRAMGEGKTGVIFLASTAKVPIVPAAITGTERMGWPWRRAVIRVRFGPPIYSYEIGRGAKGREDALNELMQRIAAMLPPAYHGFYAKQLTGQTGAHQAEDR